MLWGTPKHATQAVTASGTQTARPRVVETISVDDFLWPVMPRMDFLEDRGRTYEIVPVAADRMEVRVRTPDTSDQQTCMFGRAPCWQLQRVIDESI